MKTIFEAIKLTLNTSKRCKVIFPILFIVFFSLFLYAPTISSGLSLKQQVSYFGIKGILLLLLFSFLSALSSTMFLYSSFFMKKPAVKEASSATLGILSGLLSAILATASCSYCLIAFLGFLGSSGVFFVFENKNKFMILSIILLLTSLYFLSKRVVEGCPTCKVEL